MLHRTFLTGLAVALLAAQACGSNDGKKKVSADGDAGMGGQAGSPEVSSGGDSAGAPVGSAGAPVVEAGAGGTGTVEGTAGMGGAVEVVGGAAGQPSPPEPELLFTVKPGAVGIAGTALAGEANPQNVIYTSSTGSQAHVDGSNAVKVTGISLGLDPTDQIVSFTLVQAEPTRPLYLFTLADGSEGAVETRTYVSAHQDGGDEEANLYYSEGVQLYRDLGEGGDQIGYNALSASEVSLGLSPGAVEQSPDDLTGLAVHDARFPLTDLYFTVGADALGATDSAVSTVTPEERSCTVFQSGLDGKNSVAFSCADLGLIAGDQIDGLAIYGDAGSPTRVLFSVNQDAQGAVDSGVATELAANSEIGAALFESAGHGSNSVLKTERDLGLGDTPIRDEIDGFTVVDAPPSPSVVHGATCQVTYDPYDAVSGGSLSYISGSSPIGSNILVLFGQTTAPAVNRVLAYNATTCAFLQQKDLPAGFENPYGLAMVPLAGWSKTKPLDKIEYLRITDDDQAVGKAVRRYDDAGTFVQVFPITGTSYTDGVLGLVYEPVKDALMLLFRGDIGPVSKLAVVPRPVATDTSLAATFHTLSLPCSTASSIAGTDAAGNLYLAQLQGPFNNATTDYRVCAFRPDGELLPLPYPWSSEAASDSRGFIVPGASHFLLRSSTAPVSIERGVFQTP